MRYVEPRFIQPNFLTSGIFRCAKQRWGDANVHTIGAALFAGTDRIHFFDEIGYTHYEFTHCPTGDVWRRGRCTCNPDPVRVVGTWHSNGHFCTWEPHR